VTVEREVIQWVSEATRVPLSELTSETSLIASGRLDSLRLLGLIEFAEARFGIRLLDEDMHPDNFESIGAVTRLIQKRIVPASASQGTPTWTKDVQ
jgi:acyl carrier protein